LGVVETDKDRVKDCDTVAVMVLVYGREVACGEAVIDTVWETDTVFVGDWANEGGTDDLGVVDTVKDCVSDGVKDTERVDTPVFVRDRVPCKEGLGDTVFVVDEYRENDGGCRLSVS
jgi:hypothetical protein